MIIRIHFTIYCESYIATFWKWCKIWVVKVHCLSCKNKILNINWNLYYMVSNAWVTSHHPSQVKCQVINRTRNEFTSCTWSNLAQSDFAIQLLYKKFSNQRSSASWFSSHFQVSLLILNFYSVSQQPVNIMLFVFRPFKIQEYHAQTLNILI